MSTPEYCIAHQTAKQAHEPCGYCWQKLGNALRAELASLRERNTILEAKCDLLSASLKKADAENEWLKAELEESETARAKSKAWLKQIAELHDKVATLKAALGHALSLIFRPEGELTTADYEWIANQRSALATPSPTDACEHWTHGARFALVCEACRTFRAIPPREPLSKSEAKRFEAYGAEPDSSGIQAPQEDYGPALGAVAGRRRPTQRHDGGGGL